MPQVRKSARLWLYRRKGRKSLWLIRDGGFQRSTGFGPEDRRKAEEALADYITSKRPDTSRRRTDEIGVAEVLTLYQMDLPPNKPSRELVGYHVTNLLRFWGGKSLEQVKGSTCREYLRFRTAPAVTHPAEDASIRRYVTPSTVRRELKTLSAAINHWHKESPLVAVPLVTLPEEGARRERVLEHREAVRLLRACRRRKLAYVERFILIGLYTGTRHDAVLSLRWQAAPIGGHVDLKRGILYRKGSAETETSKRRPPVQVSGKILRLLRTWAEQDKKAGLTHVIQYNGGAIKGGFRKAWKTIRADAKLGPEVTPHILRHTCVTWNLWAGKTIWEVAGLVGADASTIERVYGHHRLISNPSNNPPGGIDG